MPSRTEVSGLLSLGTDPALNRPKTARSSGQDFGRILQASSQPAATGNRQDHPRAHSTQAGEPSASANKEPSASTNKEPSASANKETSANANKETSSGTSKENSATSKETAIARQSTAEQNAEKSNSIDQVSVQSEEPEVLVNGSKVPPGLDLLQPAPSLGGNRFGESTVALGLDKPLEALSAEDLAALVNESDILPGQNNLQLASVQGGDVAHELAVELGLDKPLEALSVEDLAALVNESDISPGQNNLQLASVQGGDVAHELAVELGLDKPLETLSVEELKELKAQVEQVLQRLLNKLEAGELTQDQQQALADLLDSLEAGANEHQIGQALEAIVVPSRVDAKDAQTQQTNLRDFLGPAGQAYLANLSNQLKGASEQGSLAQSSEADLLGKLGEEAFEADQALLKKAEVNALKEKFSDLLQLAQADRTTGRPLDLGQPSPNTNTLASLEAAGGRHLQPTERGFVVQSEVRVPVGQQPQWSQAVGQRVLWMAAQNLASAELRLDPPDLGPMQVKVSVHNDQISVNFTSAQATVREALDQGSARLREMFESEGLDLVNVDVSDQSEQQLAEEQQRRSGQGRGVSGGDEPVGEPRVTSLWVSDRLVDHYA